MKKPFVPFIVALCLSWPASVLDAQIPAPNAGAVAPENALPKPAAGPTNLSGLPRGLTNAAPAQIPPMIPQGLSAGPGLQNLSARQTNALPSGLGLAATNSGSTTSTQAAMVAVPPPAGTANTNLAAMQLPATNVSSPMITQAAAPVGPLTVVTNTATNFPPMTMAAPPPGLGPPPPGLMPAPTTPPPITNFPRFPGSDAPVEAVAVAKAAPKERVLEPGYIKFNNAPLENVFTVYADLVRRTILRAPNVNGQQTITLYSQTELTESEARQAFDYIFAFNNISMIPMGDKFILAVPSSQALQEAVPFSNLDASQLPEAAQYITEIVHLTNALPSEVKQVITPLAKMPGGIIDIDGTQTLILRDYAVNVKRMLELIKGIDVSIEPDYKLEVIPIKYGKVGDIMGVMGSLIGGGGAAGTGTPSGRSSTGGRGGRGGRARGGLSRQTTPGTPGVPNQPNAPSAAGAQNQFQRNLQRIVNAAAGGDTQILGDAKVIPDERSNSLVVYANKKDMIMLTNIVSKLDVMLAQVLIEAVVIDVTLGDSYSLGVSAIQNKRDVGKFTGTGGINSGQSFLSGITNLATGLPTGFSYFGQWAGDMQFAVSALAANNNANVLQRPRIQTTHAVAATFFSGSKEPYAGGGYGGYGYGGVGGVGGYGYPGSTYAQFLDVGIELTVTPYITPDGLVVMDISQTIDEFQGYVDLGSGLKAPRTTSRTADSSVSVKNGETIILGGFIRSSRSKTKSGVPILKDIPVLGNLFRSSSHDNTRSELIVLLRPTVMVNPEDAGRVARAEKDSLPGVKQAEKEFNDEEQKILKKVDKKNKK